MQARGLYLFFLIPSMKAGMYDWTLSLMPMETGPFVEKLERRRIHSCIYVGILASKKAIRRRVTCPLLSCPWSYTWRSRFRAVFFLQCRLHPWNSFTVIFQVAWRLHTSTEGIIYEYLSGRHHKTHTPILSTTAILLFFLFLNPPSLDY